MDAIAAATSSSRAIAALQAPSKITPVPNRLGEHQPRDPRAPPRIGLHARRMQPYRSPSSRNLISSSFTLCPPRMEAGGLVHLLRARPSRIADRSSHVALRRIGEEIESAEIGRPAHGAYTSLREFAARGLAPKVYGSSTIGVKKIHRLQPGRAPAIACTLRRRRQCQTLPAHFSSAPSRKP